MHMILLFHAHSNRKALHLQPFHSTIKRCSQFKSGAIFGVLASLTGKITALEIDYHGQSTIQSCRVPCNRLACQGRSLRRRL